jgi:hypothetical protein
MSDVEIELRAFDVGVLTAISALAAALKASPGFNNEALTRIAQHILDTGLPPPFRGPEAEEAFARPLRGLVSDQAPLIQWLGQNEPKH